MSGSVKDLVRSIRGSKTASEERAILAKECAKIRSSLNNDSISSRRKNISKLLFIHLLGHPTNFGQVECIKLIASNKFSDKRIGYLALNQLLTEDSEVLMLATNSIKIDLNNPNPYVCEMALRSLANIGTNEMLRELQNEIETLLNSNVPNIKKKAAVCTVRMLRKAAHRSLTPDSVAMDLARSFLKYVEPLVSDHDNGVKTAGLSLMSVLLEYYSEVCNLEQFFNLLLTTLGNLLNPSMTNYATVALVSPDVSHTMNLLSDSAYADPFVKVKLLSLIRQVYTKMMGNKSHSAVDGTNGSDLLGGEVVMEANMERHRKMLYELVSKIINADSENSTGNDAVLYECILAIECEFEDDKFNELGKTVVKKFMSGANNVKYIALGIIKKLHNVNMEYGDSNWKTIVQSFKQPDVSIRKKALEVALKVVNRDTLKPLVQYLYEFLLVADEDLKKDSMHKIFNCVNTHSDELGYKLQVFVKIFTIAGNCVPDLILFDFIDLLASSSEEVKADTTVELLRVLRFNMGQSALVKTALYSVGEYFQLVSGTKLQGLCNSYRSGRLSGRRDFTPKSRNGDDHQPDPEPDVPKIKETSVDLLLDLSSPVNTSTRRSDVMYETIAKDKEDDLLLDLSSSESSAPTPGGPHQPPNDGFNLYELGSYNSVGRGNVSGALVFEDEDEKSLDRGGEECLDGNEVVVELIENVSVGLMAKNMLNECEYLITSIGKLAYKMPGQVESLRKILRKFRRHGNPELQQRSCELDIMIQENIVSLVNPAEKVNVKLYADDHLLGLDLPKPEADARVVVAADVSKQEPKADVFDEFFSSPVTAETTFTDTVAVKTDPVRDKYDPDRLTNNIVENVAVASSRGKREDDFGQFDPF